LSNDNEEVEKYINDIYCGVKCTSGFFYNLFKGIKELQKISNVLKIPQMVPILIISGDEDPVGDYGKAATKLYEQYNKLCIHDIELKVYKNGRHELLNDINGSMTIDDVVEWLKKYTSIY
jgi:alpha-beta hydrolase superfamily lysophospholipase